MAQSKRFLQVRGTEIVDSDGRPIILKGCATGGHLNMENFITGYTGYEHEMRAAMLEVLGQEKYDFFFDRFLEYFFKREDAKFLASLGLNCVRIPINHRHFMNDEGDFSMREEGFRLVGRVVDACSAEGVYTILDLHTFPGGQNQGWHSDSGLHRAVLGEQSPPGPIDQHVGRDREAICLQYLAGYNPRNEPADPEHARLQTWYSRAEKAIREVDEKHILWLDGNTYSMDFSGFQEVLPNCVYAIHDYSNMGFPAGQPYTGSHEQDETLRKQYERKVQFMQEHKVPIWNGEFGPVYSSSDESQCEQINQQRYNLLGKQLSIYKEDKISWSIWLYKDIGFQGMVYTSLDSAYMRLLKPFLEKKKRLGLDKWGRDDTHVNHVYEPLIQHLKAEIPETIQRRRYPQHWGLEGHVHRVVREMLFSELLTYEYASYFEGKSLEELDKLAASFKLESCNRREGLNNILQEDAGMSAEAA